jgi:hypothetical protein
VVNFIAGFLRPIAHAAEAKQPLQRSVALFEDALSLFHWRLHRG